MFHNLTITGDETTAKCKYCSFVAIGNKKILQQLILSQGHDFDLIYNKDWVSLCCCNEIQFVKDIKEYYKKAIENHSIQSDEYIAAFLAGEMPEYVI